LAKKREISLKSYHIHSAKENYQSKKNKSSISIQSNIIKQSTIQEEEHNTIIKQWLAERLKDKLQRATILSLHHHKPILLFRKSIEEIDNAVEEEIIYLTGSHTVHMIYAYGGFIPSTFKTIEVFTLDKFIKWIIQGKNKDLLLECIEGLEQQK
jgi:hypothetical protein